LTVAAAVGPFTFFWGIMPWGIVGQPPEPGGVYNDMSNLKFITANTTALPYILVNQTNMKNWKDQPRVGIGNVYELRWYIHWASSAKSCDSNLLSVYGSLQFNILPDIFVHDPQISLDNLAGQCPQLGSVFEIDFIAANSSCSVIVTNGD
jgi:hypothetical protein